MKKALNLFLVLLFPLFFLGGCGTHSSPPPDLTPPSLSQNQPTNPAKDATGVPLNTPVTLTFTEPIDPNSLTSGTFTLSTGGTTVKGTVTVNGDNVTFKPDADLGSNTTYVATLSPGLKDMAGNAMTSGHTWSFTTGSASDTTPPTVAAGNSTSPADNATGVAVGAPITLTFSEPIDANSVTSGTFTLVSADGKTVQGTLTVKGDTVTFQPSSALAYGTNYTATAKAGITDLVGNPLGSDYAWSFTTATAPDTTPPTVASSNPTTPADGATDVAVGTSVTLTFSEPIAASSVTSGTFILNGGGTAVTGTLSVQGDTVTFKPTSSLASGTTYSATAKAAITDLSGNPLGSDYSWSFTTAAATDTTPPTVASSNPTTPADGATDVAVDTPVTLTFSEPIAASSVTSATFILNGGGTAVTGTLSVQGDTVTFQPTSNLAYSTTYTATAKAGITDLAGNSLGSDYSWSFTTAAAPDTTPPTLAASNPTSPVDGATGVPVTTGVSATFSEAMAPGSFTSANFILSAGGTTVPGTISVNGATANFTPSSDLSAGTTYTATVKGAVTDLAGNPLGSDYSWSFTTAAAAAGPAWGTPTMLNTAGVGTYSASNEGSLVKMDGQGNAIVIWWQDNLDPNILSQELWTSRYTAPTATSAGGWSTPTVIVPAVAGHDIYDPALAMNSSGQAILVWGDDVKATNTGNLYSRFFDPGTGWGAPEAVNSGVNGGLMRVVLDDSGNATMVWERSKPSPNNSSIGYIKTVGANRYVPGSGWSSEVLLEDLDYTDFYSYVKTPTLALDAAGNVTAIWMMDDSTGYYVHASRLVGGSWGSFVTIYSTPDYINPFMAAGADGNGNVTVAWKRNGSTNGSNLTIWSARFDVQTGSWNTPVNLVDSAGLGNYDLAVDSAGTAMLVWGQKPSTDMEVLARLYTPGSGWGTAESVVGANANTTNDPIPAFPQITATSGGAFWIGWQMPGQISSSAIYANQYVPASGWGTPTILRDQSNTSARMPRIEANSAGDVIMTWGDSDDNGTWASLYR